MSRQRTRNHWYSENPSSRKEVGLGGLRKETREKCPYLTEMVDTLWKGQYVNKSVSKVFVSNFNVDQTTTYIK